MPGGLRSAPFAAMFRGPNDSQWGTREAPAGPSQQAPAEDRLQGAPSDPEPGPVDASAKERAALDTAHAERSSSEGPNASGTGLLPAEPKPAEAGLSGDRKEEKETGKKGDAASKSASSWQEDEKAAFMETYKVSA